MRFLGTLVVEESAPNNSMEEFYEKVWKKHRKSADENVLQCQLVRNCVSKAKCLINLIAKSNSKRDFYAF